MWDIKLKLKDTGSSVAVIRGMEVGAVKGKGAKDRVTEDGMTLGDGHTIQYTDHVSYQCALETCMILLTNVTPIHLVNK